MSEKNNPGAFLGIEHKLADPNDANQNNQKQPIARGEIQLVKIEEEKGSESKESAEKNIRERKEVLMSLDWTVSWLKERIEEEKIEEEKIKKSWILDTVNNALKGSREAEDGKYTVKVGENSQREGAPIDDLLIWLSEEIKNLKDKDKAEVVEKLERAEQTLEQNKQSYWQAHFGKDLDQIDWNEENQKKQHWRTEYEASLIAQDWRKTGSAVDDYQKAQDALARRQELVLPKKEEPFKVEVPIKEEQDKVSKVEETVEKGPKKEKLVFANISAMIESAAWDAANAKMTTDKEKTRGVKGFFKKIANIPKNIWKYNWFYEAYKRKEYEKARKRIYRDYNAGRIDLDKLNIMAAEDEDARQEKHREAMGATFDRFSAGYDEVVENEAGEEKRKIEDENIKTEIRELIRDYVIGDISQGDLARRHNEILGKVAGEEVDVKNEVDNLLEIADRIKNSDSHNKAREALELDLEVIRGRARGGVKTEADLSRLDKIIDKMKKTRGLSWINETTLAVGATAAYCLGRRISQSFAYSKVANVTMFGTTAALSGAYAGILENKRIKEERAQHSRERAKGKTIAEGSKRRQEMETFNYETCEAQNLTQNLERIFYSTYDVKGKRVFKNLNEEELACGLGTLADLEARLSLANAHKIDLIRYSSPEEVEKERTRMLLLRAQIKADLRGKYPKGFKLNGENKEINFVQDLTETRKQELLEGKEDAKGIKEKDRLFNKMKAKKVAQRTAQAVGIGLVFGALAQEVQAELSDNNQSLIEGIRDTNQEAGYQTALSSLYEHARNLIQPGKGEGAAGEISKIMVAGQEVSVILPKGAELKDVDGDGIYALFYHNKEVCDNVSFNDDGILTDATKISLANHGVHITETLPKDSEMSGVGGIEHGNKQTEIMDVIEKHPGLFKKITHNLWYDCDTPKPIFDHNELRLDWGGKSGLGINENGDFVFSIKRMVPGGAPDGSWHDDQWIDARQAAQDGKLSILLSATHNTEQHVIEIPIDEHFNGIILKNSEAAEMLLKQGEDGQAIFLGDHAEVSQMMGTTNKDGAELIRVLATHNGEQAPILPLATPTPIPIFDIPKQMDLPPVIPVMGRKPLEKLEGKSKEAPPYLYGYGVEMLRAREGFYRERFSERLRENPAEDLDLSVEANDYLERMRRQDPEYMNDLLKMMQQQEMQEPMHDKCLVAVCIPVYDLGEGKIIEHALEQYRKQVENKTVKPEEFEIILFLNHPKEKLDTIEIKDGAEERVRNGQPEAYDTKEVLRQYQVEYPELNIRVMEKEFEKRPKWGWIIKHNYDAAIIRALTRKNPKSKDIIITTNDIDVRDMSDSYIEDVVDSFDKNEQDVQKGKNVQKIDAITGRLDYDPETYKKWPNFFIATRFEQFLNAQLRKGYNGSAPVKIEEGEDYSYSIKGKERRVRTSGANSALKGSMYCAIGGANTDTDCGADTELGAVIQLARGGVLDDRIDVSKGPIKYDNKIWLDTDPRRQIDKYKQGEPIVNAWNDWAKMAVYGKKFEEQIEGDKEKIDQERLEYEFENILKIYAVKADSRVVERALNWLGFQKGDYEVKDNKIKINKLDNLLHQVDEWIPRREHWQKNKERKERENQRQPF